MRKGLAAKSGRRRFPKVRGQILPDKGMAYLQDGSRSQGCSHPSLRDNPGRNLIQSFNRMTLTRWESSCSHFIFCKSVFFDLNGVVFPSLVIPSQLYIVPYILFLVLTIQPVDVFFVDIFSELSQPFFHFAFRYFHRLLIPPLH